MCSVNCQECNEEYLTPFQNYCENCGFELSGLHRRISRVWDPQHSLAAPLNWLAQAHRRLKFPIEESDGTGFRGLEYVWKAFNNVYRSHFPVPGDAAAWRQLAGLLVSQDYFDGQLVPGLAALVEFVENDFQIPSSSDRNGMLHALFSRPESDCEAFRNTLNDFPIRLSAGLNLVYDLRNATVHGDDDAVTRQQGGQGTVVRDTARMLLGLVSHLLTTDPGVARQPITPLELEEIVYARRNDVMRQIKTGAMAWDICSA